MRHRGSERADGRGTGPRQADRREVGVGERLGPRKEVRESVLRLVERCAECAHHPPGERRRAAHRHLLAEHRPHRELEAVPRPGHPETRAARHQRRQHAAASQVVRDQRRIRVEVEETPRSLHHLEQVLGVREPDAHEKMRLARGRAHLDRAPRVADRDRPPINAVRDRLDARCGTLREEGEEPRPVERRPIRQPHHEAGPVRAWAARTARAPERRR